MIIKSFILSVLFLQSFVFGYYFNYDVGIRFDYDVESNNGEVFFCQENEIGDNYGYRGYDGYQGYEVDQYQGYTCESWLNFSLNETEIKELIWDIEFIAFMDKYNKTYSSLEETLKKRDIFVENQKMINEHNANRHEQGLTYTLAMNHAGDVSQEQHKTKLVKMNRRNKLFNNQIIIINDTLPESVDWRKHGVVTPVKNQLSCGGCYAESGVESVESLWAIKKGKLLELSVQQVLDCSYKEGDEGCNGGLPDDVFQYVLDNKGLCLESKYPFEGKDDTCHTCSTVAHITGYEDIPSYNENVLMQAVVEQPVSIAMSAQASMQFYHDGIYNAHDCDGKELNHALQIVGFDQKEGFWWVRNSWGTDWSNYQGYMKVAMGRESTGGVCGILTSSSYPTLTV